MSGAGRLTDIGRCKHVLVYVLVFVCYHSWVQTDRHRQMLTRVRLVSVCQYYWVQTDIQADIGRCKHELVFGVCFGAWISVLLATDRQTETGTCKHVLILFSR